MNHDTFKYFAIGTSAVVAMFALCFTIMAWTEPSSTPPNVNVGAPLNTSINDQTKTGRLNIGSGLEYWITKIGDSFALVNAAGKTNFIVGQTDGNVGFDTDSPAGRFDMEGGGKICLNGYCCNSWQDCFLGASGGWVSGACEGGGCGKGQRQQYVACTLPGCKPTFTRCVEDSTCGQSVVCTKDTGCSKCLGYAQADACNFSNANVNVCAISSTGTGNCNYIEESFENTDCNIMKGWACNMYTPTDPLVLSFYMDEVSNPGGYLGQARADGETGAPSQVKNLCNGTSTHEFTFNMPQRTSGNWAVNDGLPHKIYVVGKQSNPAIATYGGYTYLFPTVQALRCSPQ